MFEGLDEIEWANLKHYDGEMAVEAPRFIRQLRSENKDDRSNAISHLFNYGIDQYYFTVSEALPYILSFVIELVKYEDTPDRDRILLALADIIEVVIVSLKDNANHRNLKDIEDDFEIYEIFERDYELFSQLAQHTNAQIRIGSIAILSCLSTFADKTANQLRNFLEEEEDDAVRTEIIKSIVQLIVLNSIVELREEAAKCQSVLVKLFREEEMPNIRVLIARALLYQTWRYPKLEHLENIKDDLVDVLISAYLVWIRMPLIWSYSLDEIYHVNLLSLISNLGLGYLLKLINDARITPYKAHFVVVELLDKVFHRPDLIEKNTSFNEQDFQGVWNVNEGIQYQFANYVSQGPHGELQITVLNAIVNCDSFWLIPTNLFSFFFGLPDTREALQNLISQH